MKSPASHRGLGFAEWGVGLLLLVVAAYLLYPLVANAIGVPANQTTPSNGSPSTPGFFLTETPLASETETPSPTLAPSTSPSPTLITPVLPTFVPPTPSYGCSYENPSCPQGYYCASNLCYVVTPRPDTLANASATPTLYGCAYTYPPCPSNYYCVGNGCAYATPTPAPTPPASPTPTPVSTPPAPAGAVYDGPNALYYRSFFGYDSTQGNFTITLRWGGFYTQKTGADWTQNTTSLRFDVRVANNWAENLTPPALNVTLRIQNPDYPAHSTAPYVSWNASTKTEATAALGPIGSPWGYADNIYYFATYPAGSFELVLQSGADAANANRPYTTSYLLNLEPPVPPLASPTALTTPSPTPTPSGNRKPYPYG